MSSETLNTLVRSSAHLLGKAASLTSLTSRAYLSCLRAIVPRLSSKKRSQVVNSISRINWPSNCFKPRRVVLGNGTQVLLKPHQGEFDFASIMGGKLTYEQDVFQFLEPRLSQYDVIIEIGANVGVFTVFFEKGSSESTRIYSFEPSISAYTRLLENLHYNDCKRTTTFQCAVGDRSRIAWFFEPEGHLTNGSLVEGFASSFADNVKRNAVMMMSALEIQSILEKSNRSLIKIDVEGFEAEILTTLTPVLQQYKSDVVIEVLPEFEKPINQAIASLGSDYKFYAITKEGLVPQQSLHALEGSRDCFLSIH